MSRKQIYDKYFNSHIFNNDPSLSSQVPKVRTRISQAPLLKTKDDIFNTENKLPNSKEPLTKKGVKRLGVYSKLYGSDIFCKTNPNPNQNEKKTGVKKIRNANNYSSCFDSMKNLDEYKQNLKKYTKERRTEKKIFKPDKKYLINETPSERYYREMYDTNEVNLMPERCFSADRYNKEKYAERKKNWKKDVNKLNDEISDIKLNPKENKRIFVRKKNKWTDNNSGNYHYINTKQNPVKNAKINKQIYLSSNIFNTADRTMTEKNRNKTLDKISTRIEEEKNRINKNNRYHLSLHEKKRDLSGNDRMLYGAVHSKWEKSKMDWLNPQTELIFGTQAIKDLKKEFGPKGPNAFQRKLNQLADSKNIDIINEEEKQPINKIKPPCPQNQVNDIPIGKWAEILEDIPNLKQDKKLKIKMDATSSILSNENDLEKKANTLKKFYTSPNRENLIKKEKKEVTGKIGNKKGNNITKKILEEKSGHDFNNYVLSYSTKDNFEKFGENDIKKMFEKNGVHIYDVRKNMFDKGTYNVIKFKVREDNEGQNALNNKINDIEKNLGKNYKIKINKEKKKNLKINSKNFVSNPGAKLVILNENIGVYDNAKYTKIPDNIRNKKSFSKQFEQINYKYKKNN